MLDRDQDLALQALAHAIAQCLETVGPVCTARLLDSIALDLIQADGYTNEATLPQPHPCGQYSPEPHEAVTSRHLGADQIFLRPAEYSSAATR